MQSWERAGQTAPNTLVPWRCVGEATPFQMSDGFDMGSISASPLCLISWNQGCTYDTLM